MSFRQECDRILSMTDQKKFEELDWKKTDGATLEELASVASQLFGSINGIEVDTAFIDRKLEVLVTAWGEPRNRFKIVAEVNAGSVLVSARCQEDWKLKVGNMKVRQLQYDNGFDNQQVASVMGEIMAEIDSHY